MRSNNGTAAMKPREKTRAETEGTIDRSNDWCQVTGGGVARKREGFHRGNKKLPPKSQKKYGEKKGSKTSASAEDGSKGRG